jgi:hypothetical protein
MESILCKSPSVPVLGLTGAYSGSASAYLCKFEFPGGLLLGDCFLGTGKGGKAVSIFEAKVFGVGGSFGIIPALL